MIRLAVRKSKLTSKDQIQFFLEKLLSGDAYRVDPSRYDAAGGDMYEIKIEGEDKHKAQLLCKFIKGGICNCNADVGKTQYVENCLLLEPGD